MSSAKSRSSSCVQSVHCIPLFVPFVVVFMIQSMARRKRFLDKSPGGTTFLVLALLVRVVQAVGMAAYSTAAYTIISNEFPNHLGTVLGYSEAFYSIGFMAGPTIGGVLYQLGGFGCPFWVLGVVIIVCGGSATTSLPRMMDNERTRKGSVLTLLRSPLVWVTIMSIMMGSAGSSFMDPTLSEHLEQFGLSTLVIGLMFSIEAALYAATASLWGYVSDTLDLQSPLLIGGNLFCGVGFALIGPTAVLSFLPVELWVITVGLIIFGLSVGCSSVPTMKCLMDAAGELGLPDNLETFGLVSGLFLSVYSCGAFIGPSIAGALVDKSGFRYASSIVSAMYLFAFIVTSIFFAQRHCRKRCKEWSIWSLLTPESESLPLLHVDSSSLEKEPSATCGSRDDP